MEQTNDRSALAARVRIRRAQKVWKFIRDVNNTSLCDLNRVALEDGARSYTYGLMFREWERYASVFSALGMTGEMHSRVGLLGSTCVETIFALYGLNMVGADVSVVPSYSALMPKRIIQTIRDERLTDFIVTDDFAQANFINELFLRQKELGLEHIILLHVPVNGVTVHPMLTTAQEAKYHQIKGFYKPICMDELLAAHGNHPVRYAPEDSGDTAFILHTSGTTTGAGKPVALSDAACNAAAAVFYNMEELQLPMDHLVTAMIVDLSNAYSMIDQVHLPLAMGAKVVLVPGGILNPLFYKAVAKYEISVLFTISAMFERWMKMPEGTDFDFSSLRLVVLGGTAVSAADKRRFDAFLRAHGAGEITLLNGYGISELGGACCLSSPELDDEAIGYPLPGVNVRLFDDESGKFLSARNTPCEGVLYLNSPSVATPELDGETILKFEVLNHKRFICTNDLVHMDPDGKLTFLGRANRYFINEEGRRFESGRVETEIARQEGIESCCIVPVYVKTTHDNIPQLCVATLPDAGAAQEVVLRALKQVYVTKRTLGPDQLPSRVMLAVRLPRNGNGKIDLFQIGQGKVEGGVFTLEPVCVDGEIKDFRLVPCAEGPADMIQEVFDGIAAELKDSMPFHSSKKEENKEVPDMKCTKMAYESFNAMNRMGRQMMSNMMGRMGQMSCGAASDENPMGQMVKHMAQMNLSTLSMLRQMNDQHQKMMNLFFDSVQKMNENLSAEKK